MDKKKILVVEDEDALLKILTDNLTNNGFQVFQAKNGQEGLELAKKEHPNLILLDIMMPVMDGITALKKLREEYGDYGKNVPVIALTNLEDSQNISAGMEYKVSHYWIKSDWKLNDLIQEVKEKLEVMERIYPQQK
jgi:two-component system, OmpR family, alkaline phosphatase synthesis response regulator PhoP